MSIKIHLDNPGILTPGATISGTAICHFEHPEVIRGITCVFKGREYTHWDVQRSRNSVKFVGKNDFVSQERRFAHAGTLPARTYKYQFVFNLPDRQLPSSFDHDCAAIQYFIKAKVDRPIGFDYKDSVSLHVASPVDLNDFVDQISMRPLRNQLEEFPSCCFFTSEPLLLDFTINKDAFVVGETIFVKINVNNTSSLHVSEVKLSLIQRLNLKVENPDIREREENEVINQVRALGVEAHSEKEYFLQLKIPQDLLVPLFLNCRLIKQSWVVRAKFTFQSCQSDIICESIVKLGHIAIGTRDIVADLPLSGANISSSSIDWIPSDVFVEQEGTTELLGEVSSAPPSYNEVNGYLPKYETK
ncbi:unnamed protein product [Diabrotica balteata]|uniref:Arrestin C-terminal-like domain-containing protein n=1 Tax=Diabrotica balteata TaxID=107213 RepID=A0A9N9T0S0_DIABA|nr:unnamed protein product [Diabrotica balteata]